MSTTDYEWNMEREGYLLNLMCFHRPLGKNATECLSIIEKKLAEKYTEPKLTSAIINAKINEYYDMVGLSKLDSRETNTSEPSSQHVVAGAAKVEDQANDNKEDGEKPLEDKDAEEIQTRNQFQADNSVNFIDKEKVKEEDVEDENKLKEIEKAKGKEDADDAEEEAHAEKKHIKHVTIDEDKNKVFVETVPFKETEKDNFGVTNSNDSVEKADQKKKEPRKEGIIKNLEKEEQLEEQSKVKEARERSEGENEVEQKDEEEKTETVMEQANEGKRDASEKKEDTDEDREDSEEPAHLTRAQARKLHINVEKETQHNEKKAHDLEEARRTKYSGTRGTSETGDEEEDAPKSEDAEESENDANNLSVAVESEPEEKVEEPTSTTPRKRGRRRNTAEDVTPRRSTRLRRRSDQEDDENTENDVGEPAIGKRTRSSSSGRTHQPPTPLSPESTAPRGGRKRKTTPAPETEVPTRRTRSKRRGESDNEGGSDKEVDDAKQSKEGVREAANISMDKVKSVATEDGQREEAEEKEKEHNEDKEEVDEAAEGMRLRRSSRKRRLDTPNAEPTTVSKKQKTAAPAPAPASASTAAAAAVSAPAPAASNSTTPAVLKSPPPAATGAATPTTTTVTTTPGASTPASTAGSGGVSATTAATNARRRGRRPKTSPTPEASGSEAAAGGTASAAVSTTTTAASASANTVSPVPADTDAEPGVSTRRTRRSR